MNKDTIICEEIKRYINESFVNEKKSAKNDGNKEISDLINNFLKRTPSKKNKKKKKLRRTKNGGRIYYDYNDYERKNPKISLGDANSIRNSIDTERTNIAAVARDLFPDHTDEGAQSQFRKIINGERPMTKKIASKIEKLISRGKIAVK